tara:strand:- start:269 stop:400 length:132 start_codon:yes stop_codon:yes gene_type:complete
MPEELAREIRLEKLSQKSSEELTGDLFVDTINCQERTFRWILR